MKYKSYQKRDAIKNYFPLPNEIFMLGLTSGAIAVYTYLLYCEDRKTFQCYPSYNTIGKAVRMSKNTVQKYVSELENKSLISTQHTSVFTKDGLKQNGNLLYTIRPIQDAVDFFYQKQLSQAQEMFLADKFKSKIDSLNQRKDISFCGEESSVI